MIDLAAGTYCAGPPHAVEHSWLLEYIGKCRVEEIIVGRELHQMFDILLGYFKDPEVSIANKTYTVCFELTDAHKRIRFIEEKCKHFEAPFAGKPFILMLFQKAFIEAFYSFKIFDDEIGRLVRLYQEYLLLIGRKNGKTPLESALDLAEFFCGPMGVKIMCSSNDYEQADLMFQAIDAMRVESPSLEKRTWKNIKGIKFGNPRYPKIRGKFSKSNHGNIRKLSAKTGAKEARNLYKASVDESHELKDNTSVMPLKQSLSTQDEPIYGEITTEGFTNGGYLDDELIEARLVLSLELDRPRWLIWLYTQDSEAEIWQDEKSWVKSNPGIGVIKKWAYLRQKVEESRTNMKTRAFVLAKDFNIKQNNAAAWLSLDIITNEELFDISLLRGCIGIGFVDLAQTTDLVSARMMVMRPNDKKKYMVQHYFIPEAKLDVRDDDKDYREWLKQELLTVSPGNDNDFSLVTQWFVKCVKEYGIRPFKIGYDTALAKYWCKEMTEIFPEDTMVKIAQKREVLSEPMSLLEADLRADLIIYNNNEMDAWCLSNIALDIDKRMMSMPIKVQGKPEKKIDGGVTMIGCEAVYQQYKSEYLKLVG